MSLSHWLSNVKRYYQYQPPGTATKMVAGELAAGGIRRATPVLPRPGEPLFEKEWEVLVVLDACRPEALNDVADEFEYLPSSVKTTCSRGSASEEWMKANFTADYAGEMARTAHITANPNSEECLDVSGWLVLDEIWRTNWDDEVQMVPPRPVTDSAIARWRELDPDRLIVHYMQPHAPYPGFLPDDIDDPSSFDRQGDREGEFTWLQEGRVTRREMWSAYLDTLRSVLEEVELLLDNVSSDDVVITADHGELFGEYGLYAHPIRTWVPKLLRVPWIHTSATDTGTYTPTIDDELVDVAAEDQLEALGYKE